MQNFFEWARAKTPDQIAHFRSFEHLTPENASFQHTLPNAIPFMDPEPKMPLATKPKMKRHRLLAELHQLLAPRTYLEVGVDFGEALTLSRTKTIAVDPVLHVSEPVSCDLQLIRAKSDDFFAQPNAFAHFAGLPVDLAFLDGMHLSEYLLRDFIGTEKAAGPGSVVVLDDVLPRNSLESTRIRRTGGWTGDCYKVLYVLAKYRPDLILIPLNTKPTGTVIIANLDPTNHVLENNYPDIERMLQSPDPQLPPDFILRREIAFDPISILAIPIWSQIRDARDSGQDTEITGLWENLREAISEEQPNLNNTLANAINNDDEKQLQQLISANLDLTRKLAVSDEELQKAIRRFAEDESSLEAAGAIIDQQQSRIANLEGTIARQQEVLDSTFGSVSWVVTRPVRAIRRGLSTMFNNNTHQVQ